MIADPSKWKYPLRKRYCREEREKPDGLDDDWEDSRVLSACKCEGAFGDLINHNSSISIECGIKHDGKIRRISYMGKSATDCRSKTETLINRSDHAASPVACIN